MAALEPSPRGGRVAIVGGGPAGLMAAQTARAAGATVDLFERLGSVGRKFLIAGKGGLNLTHSDPFDAFVARYRGRERELHAWLRGFDANALRAWAADLGVPTFVGSSGRVFPIDLKAAPLLRGWVRRLRADGVNFHVHQQWSGWSDDGALRFNSAEQTTTVHADAVVFAFGGGSWPVLGSDGRWFDAFQRRGIELAPLLPANCGFDIDRGDGNGWSELFARKYAGQPLKPVSVIWRATDGSEQRRQGEFVVTATGVEGSLIYALSADLRDAIAAHGGVTVHLDLAPARSIERLRADLATPRGKRTLSEHLRRHAGIDGVKAGLLFEQLAENDRRDPERLAAAIKALPLSLARPRPLDEAISTAGGVRFAALDEHLMLRSLPGNFCAGEMIDWEAPTGGYLLTACFASGKIAGAAAAQWALRRS